MSFELNSPETASGKVGGFPVPAAPLSCGGTGVGRVNENNPLDVGSIDVTAGETATISPAAPPSQARSQLATGAYPGARRLSIKIAEGMPNPLGNTRVPQPTSSPAGALHPSRSSQHQPMHNLRGRRSERNKTIPVRVGNDADLRAGRAHLSRKRPVLRFFSPRLVGRDPMGLHPSFLSPGHFTAGVSQPQRVRSGDSIVGISHRALGKTSREIGGHEHVCVR